MNREVMNEQEWLSADPAIMLEDMPQPVSERKARLFGVACCKRMWHMLGEVGRRAVTVAEEFADRNATPQDLLAILHTTTTLTTNTDIDHFTTQAIRALLYTPELDFAFAIFGGTAFPFPSSDKTTRPTSYASYISFFVAGALAHSASGPREELVHAEYEAQRRLVLDIFGNPFSPSLSVMPEAFVADDDLMGVVETVYSNADFSMLPVIADMLSRRGCTNQQVLNHCLLGVPHVRGCWVIDRLLGKT